MLLRPEMLEKLGLTLHHTEMRTLLWLIAVTIAGTACAEAPPALETTFESQPRTIYLVSHGWHTGIVIRLSDLPHDAWPESTFLPRAEYIEVGWGDREYYQAADPGAWLALKAAFVPGPSVLHVVGFHTPVEQYFSTSEVIALPVSDAGLARLVAYIRDNYARDDAGHPIQLGVGLYGESAFYESVETFHLFNNCNTWTAHALRIAGIRVGSHLTAPELMKDARQAAQTAPSGTYK